MGLRGFSQLWFDDANQSRSAFSDGALAADLIDDENHFLGGLHIFTAEQAVANQLPDQEERTRLLKRISVIRRKPSLSEDDFRREWRVHG